ncbi:MAG TPA: polymer-forming cytoskeletal protein [Candidatus Binataceae bacterium]|nr:polymer-forming cytoskeletal protein [Candidatus Binataceae bacterium]
MAVQGNDQPEFLKIGSKLPESSKPDSRSKQDPQPSGAGEPNGWVQERTRIAVGHGVNVSGKLIFNEPVRIEGTFRGEVSSTSLVVIAETGTVEGRMKASRLVVLGEMRGDIVDASRAYLGSHARVYGDITADNLTVCEGAYFSGNVKMTSRRAA